MGTLWRQTITRYRVGGPKGKVVRKGTPGAKKYKEKSPVWRGRWRNAQGDWEERSLSRNKDTARQMLAELERQAQLESVTGIGHQGATLTEHLAAYGRSLQAEGNTQEHVKRQLQRCRDIIKFNEWEKITDIRLSGVQDFLLHLQEDEEIDIPDQPRFSRKELASLLRVTLGTIYKQVQRGVMPPGTREGHKVYWSKEQVEQIVERSTRGIGPVTVNHYITAIKGFSRWLVKDRRTISDPLQFLSHLNPDVDLRHQRRTLPEAEFSRFVEATGAGKAHGGLTGPARLVLYVLAANTGLRAGELASLAPESFDLGAIPASVTVAASYSKRRRKDVLPLRPDVAALMKQYLEDRPKGQPVFPGNWPDHAAAMIQRDLQAAGLPYQDERGLFFDFHALRHTFITNLASGGVHPKVAQVLARHSTITLTMDFYTHTDHVDLGEALDKLPGLRREKEKEEE